MKTFIKYELKGTYKIMLAIFAVASISTTILQLKIATSMFYNGSLVDSKNMAGGLAIIIITIIILIATAISSFVYLTNSYRKELDEDRGYLTFTLPLTGNQILGSKLVVAIFWYIVQILAIFLYNLILAVTIYGKHLQEILNIILSDFNLSFISVMLSNVISISLTMILVYFAITLSRVTFKNKRLGGVWFIIFLILDFTISTLIAKIAMIIPYFINLNTFAIAKINDLKNLIPGGSNTSLLNAISSGQLTFVSEDLVIYTSVVGVILTIVAIVGVFLATGYLVEKKINL